MNTTLIIFYRGGEATRATLTDQPIKMIDLAAVLIELHEHGNLIKSHWEQSSPGKTELWITCEETS